LIFSFLNILSQHFFVVVGYITFKNLQLCITKTKIRKLAVEQLLVETFFAPTIYMFNVCLFMTALSLKKKL